MDHKSVVAQLTMNGLDLPNGVGVTNFQSSPGKGIVRVYIATPVGTFWIDWGWEQAEKIAKDIASHAMQARTGLQIAKRVETNGETPE